MDPIYSLDFTISDIHVDRFGRVKPSVLLYFVQEAAGQHCSLLAVDYDRLSHKHLFWAVTRNRVQVTRLPMRGERITVKTWPMPTSRTAYPRCVMGFGADGRLLFKVLSLWVLMDVSTRAMVLPAKSGVEVIGSVEGGEPELPRGLPVTQQENTVYKTVEQCHLDRNGHMNNTRYMDWVAELAPEKAVKSLELCYFNEGRLGDRMELDYDQSEDSLTVNIHRQRTDDPHEKDRIFAALVQF